MAYYREDLDTRSVCGVPGCPETSHTGEIYFHSLCHIDSPTWVHYRGDVLTVECARCGSFIASFVVASRTSEVPP